MAKRVIWTRSAIEDLKSLLEYSKEQGSARARALIFIKAVEKLENFPKVGKILPDLDHLNYYELAVGAHRAIFKEIDDQVVILAASHAKPIGFV